MGRALLKGCVNPVRDVVVWRVVATANLHHRKGFLVALRCAFRKEKLTKDMMSQIFNSAKQAKIAKWRSKSQIAAIKRGKPRPPKAGGLKRGEPCGGGLDRWGFDDSDSCGEENLVEANHLGFRPNLLSGAYASVPGNEVEDEATSLCESTDEEYYYQRQECQYPRLHLQPGAYASMPGNDMKDEATPGCAWTDEKYFYDQQMYYYPLPLLIIYGLILTVEDYQPGDDVANHGSTTDDGSEDFQLQRPGHCLYAPCIWPKDFDAS